MLTRATRLVLRVPGNRDPSLRLFPLFGFYCLGMTLGQGMVNDQVNRPPDSKSSEKISDESPRKGSMWG